MRFARFPVFGFALVFFTACGSNPVVQDRYYSLVLAAEGVAVSGDDERARSRLIVGPIQLPSYLSTRRLPLQVGVNEIESANHHYWAEPLDEAIAKVLTRDIAVRTDGIDVEREAGRWTPENDCRVRLEFDAFHPTSDSRVLTSGRYWVSSEDTSRRHAFNLTRTLTMDGYAHAVDVLRDTLEVLADQISVNVRETSVCNGVGGSEQIDQHVNAE